MRYRSEEVDTCVMRYGDGDGAGGGMVVWWCGGVSCFVLTLRIGRQ